MWPGVAAVAGRTFLLAPACNGLAASQSLIHSLFCGINLFRHARRYLELFPQLGTVEWVDIPMLGLRPHLLDTLVPSCGPALAFPRRRPDPTPTSTRVCSLPYHAPTARPHLPIPTRQGRKGHCFAHPWTTTFEGTGRKGLPGSFHGLWPDHVPQPPSHPADTQTATHWAGWKKKGQGRNQGPNLLGVYIPETKYYLSIS